MSPRRPSGTECSPARRAFPLISLVRVCVRELEALIFQCGLHVDELKERAKETPRDGPGCEAPPHPSRNATPSSAPAEEGGAILIHPQVP